MYIYIWTYTQIRELLVQYLECHHDLDIFFLTCSVVKSSSLGLRLNCSCIIPDNSSGLLGDDRRPVPCSMSCSKAENTKPLFVSLYRDIATKKKR